MGIFVIAAAVAALVGIIGAIANLAVPAWRPRGSRRKAAVVRLALFGALTVIGAVAVIALSSAGSGTIHYGLGEQASVESAE